MNRAAVIRRLSLAMLVMLIAVAGVLVAQRFRGGSAPEEIGRRYLSGVQRGDTVALLWLMPPGREQPDAIGERISRYRGISKEQIETEFVTHGVASYIKFVCVSVGGAPFDEVVLTQMANRWYLANVPKTSSAYCRQASKSVSSGAAAPSVFPRRTGRRQLRRLFDTLRAAYPSAIERGQLADLLWPDSDGDRSIANLYAAINDLRHLLSATPGVTLRVSDGAYALELGGPARLLPRTTVDRVP